MLPVRLAAETTIFKWGREVNWREILLGALRGVYYSTHFIDEVYHTQFYESMMTGREWCADNISRDDWYFDDYHFWFTYEKDAALFKLFNEGVE